MKIIKVIKINGGLIEKIIKYIFFILLKFFNLQIKLYNGDWGLGIGDWAQSPIPNPQSPI